MTPESPPTFLLVEDDAAHAGLIERGLRACGVPIEFVRVRHFDEAMEYLYQRGVYSRCGRPHLIVLDLALPGVDGHEALRRFKNDKHVRDIPVIVFTASDNPEDRRLAYENRANGYVVKPAELEEFNQMCYALGQYWAIWNLPCPA